MEILLRRGADPALRDNEGRTARDMGGEILRVPEYRMDELRERMVATFEKYEVDNWSVALKSDLACGRIREKFPLTAQKKLRRLPKDFWHETVESI